MALNQGSVPQKLKEQLSLAVRNIQWSYAIFWSISATQPGVLEWGEGYYNGDIKTRKTIQAVEFNAEELGLQRSEQLRELYDSLSAGDSSPHCKRPSAALSPEDLSDTEWYYLVCMSFVFDFGQCLPGRTLATGKPFWLCNAHSADSKIFTRSLLAKSASIQTIVCFPFLGGVIELGTIEQVLEDLETIQRIKDTYLEIQQSICIKKPDTHQTSNADLPCDNNICNTDVVPVLPRLDISSPNIDVAPDDIPEDSLIFEAMNDDEEFHHSSGDCISQTFVKLGNSGLLSKEKLAAMDPVTDDLFYKSVISSLVNSQDRLVSGPCSRKHESSFVKWKNGGLLNVRKIIASESQKLLKRMLFEVPRISERFQMLNSILPTVNKANEASVLDNAINYLNELKKRVADLESHRIDSKELAARPRKNLLEPSEQTSDNYKSINTTPTRHKRKNRDRDETTNLTVSVSGNVVQIDVKCSWREGLLLEIVEALRSLHLDSHTVQSSIFDAVLFLNMKCKICGSMIGSAGLIRQKLEKVVRRS